MKRIHKFLTLPARHRRLLVIAMLVVGGIRLGLWFLPFHTFRRLLTGKPSPKIGLQVDETSIDSVVWAVTVASQYVPRATCLVRAFATQLLLGWFGHSTCLCIGVSRDAQWKLESHAWLESPGRIVIGNLADLSRYILLQKWDKW